MIKYFLEPKTIAVIGATDREESVGYSIVNNLMDKNIFLVNPNNKNILGHQTYKSVKDIKQKIDLAIIVVPATIVPSVLIVCGESKIKQVIIISSGFKEAGNDKLDSFQVVPPFSKFAVPIETLKEYARQTSNEMLDEVLSEQIINKLEEHGIELRTF